ncbi:MAG: hypothetical protein LBU92_02975 [Prevotellaceae bacterium]|jgi:uncharacterized protein YbjQ (UPF0145 family)|nr:hypothetical protein [Prevotellaceae bacterium]
MKKTALHILFLAVVVWLTGCATAKVTMIDTTSSYAPKGKEAVIDVYDTATVKVNREYTELAQIVCKAEFSEERSMKLVTEKARKLGADGVIIVKKETSTQTIFMDPATGIISGIGTVPLDIESYGIIATAIKYKK